MTTDAEASRAPAPASALTGVGGSDAPAPYVTVIGIGNTLMGDDGVGVRVAEALSRRDLGEGAAIVVGSVAGMGLVSHLLASPHVIFVDAIDTGDEPGSIFLFDPDEAGITNLRSNTIHGMSVSYLVTSARFAGADPNVLVYAVQVGDVRPNPDVLSPEVAEAALAVETMLAEKIAALLAERG